MYLDSAKINIREKLNPYFAKYRRNKLKNKNFTIISNNCWGGTFIDILICLMILQLLGSIFFRLIMLSLF